MIKGTSDIIDSVKKIEEVAQKIDFIFQNVKNKIKWNEMEVIFAEDVNRAWKTGIGSSAEINLIILNLLRKAKINCFPILTRSRQFGKANRSLSSLGQFNNVNILVIDSTHFYVLDGTKKNLSYKTPPLEVLNRDVFLVDTFRMQWINIIDPSPFLKNNITIKAEMDSTGNIYGDAYISYFDFFKRPAY